MFQHIALAVDGSENSIRATKEAIKIAKGVEGSFVEVILVADFTKAKNEVLHSQSKEALEMERRRKIRDVEEALLEEKVKYDVKILHGEPGPSIVEYVNANAFDLVVIGSRGLNTLQEMVLGSVSHKVVKRANAPVLIVK